MLASQLNKAHNYFILLYFYFQLKYWMLVVKILRYMECVYTWSPCDGSLRPVILADEYRNVAYVQIIPS